MIISDLLNKGIDDLKKGGIANPVLDAEVMLSHLLKVEKFRLIVDSAKEASPEQCRAYKTVIKRRLKFEPVAYITGQREFYSIPLEVNRHVLIPRPETELLVDLAIYYAAMNGTVLDVGTGSGAIAIAVKHTRADLRVSASDISGEAVKMARRNTTASLGRGAVRFYTGDLFSPFTGMRFDIIVSNPPYIDRDDAASLQKEIFYEPEIALFSKAKGRDVLQRIINEAGGYLNPRGFLILEIGCSMKDFIIDTGESSGFSVSVLNDYAGLPRVALLRGK